MNDVVWKPMRTVPKKVNKTVTLLGTTDNRSEEYRELVGYYDEEIACFTTEDGWAIAAVAWR